MTVLRVYVAYKPEASEAPHLICDGVDMTATSGLTYYEDEVGWYYISGELSMLDPTNDD